MESAAFIFRERGLLLYPEDGNIRFLRKVCRYLQNYKASQLKHRNLVRVLVHVIMWILSYVAVIFFSFDFVFVVTAWNSRLWVVMSCIFWKLSTAFGSIPLIQSLELQTAKISVYFLAIKTLIWQFHFIPVNL